MSNILVILQHSNGRILKASLSALTAAREIAKVANCSNINALCLGSSSKQAAEAALEYGIIESYYSEESIFQNYLAWPYSEASKVATEKCSASFVVAPATSNGKDMMPLLAALLDAGQASDILAVNQDGSFKRPMYAGNVFADVELNSTLKLITVRPTAFQPATTSSKIGKVSEITLPSTLELKAEFVSFEGSGGERPDLQDAEIVVSGGRALKSSEIFMQYMAPLADALGAAIGASRAAVDSGYAPNDWQVGQTGKVVAPALYVAVGISGAIQHLAGMKDSKTIVAINKDGDAPIFEVADYGLVGDLFEILPALTEQIKKARAS